jgi:indolepyruvate ferredoxin oxidoreductase beta subunit
VIRKGGRGAAASLAGFALAFEHVAADGRRAARVDAVLAVTPADATAGAQRGSPPPAIAERFPPETHAMLRLGHARIVEYQDAAYGALYLERMARVLAAEQRSDLPREHGAAITIEAARYLALWMAFDDIVRVAELKSRASRAARVRREVKPGANDVLRVYDHFKPGMPEIAALLPARLGERLVRWDRRRQQRGKPAWALPLKLPTHTVTGMLALRILGALQGVRRRGARFALEQALIERWLHAVVDGTRRDWSLGHELALSGRLIKGYGSTNERGKENLLHIIDHLAHAAAEADALAAAIRAARTAALADESGSELDRTLVAHGAPPRPVKAVPIRFIRNPVAAR